MLKLNANDYFLFIKKQETFSGFLLSYRNTGGSHIKNVKKCCG